MLIPNRKNLILPVTILGVVLFTSWYVFGYGEMNREKIIPWMIVIIIPCSVYGMWSKNLQSIPPFVFPAFNLLLMTIAVVWNSQSWVTAIWVQKIVNILLMWLTLTVLTVLAKRFAPVDQV